MADALFLLDSNICIYIVDGGAPALRQRLQQLAPGEAVTSAITFAEVMRGRVRTAEVADRMAALFTTFPVVPFDQAAARRFEDVPFARGKFDRLIAAHALALNAVLVTNNERDFADVPGLEVQNWTR